MQNIKYRALLVTLTILLKNNDCLRKNVSCIFLYRHDVCDCPDEKECACEALADYARQCAAMGVVVSWRNETICRK